MSGEFQICLSSPTASNALPLNDAAEYAHAIGLFKKSTLFRLPVGWESIIPVDPLRVYDLLCPKLHRTIQRAHNTTQTLIALITDLLTLPLRLVTFLPRLICTTCLKPEDHKIIAFLKSKGFSDDVINAAEKVKLFAAKRGEAQIFTYGLFIRNLRSGFEPHYMSRSRQGSSDIELLRAQFLSPA